MKPYFFQSRLSRVMLQDTGPHLGVAKERQAATGHQICIPRLHDGNQMQLAICQGGEAKAWPYIHGKAESLIGLRFQVAWHAVGVLMLFLEEFTLVFTTM